MLHRRPARPPLLLLLVVGAVLGLLAPATVLADDPLPHDGSVLFVANGDIAVPAGGCCTPSSRTSAASRVNCSKTVSTSSASRVASSASR